jgi:hypothetical protein
MPKANLKHAEQMIEAGQPVVSNTGSFVGDWKFDEDSYAYVVSSYGVPVAELRRRRVVDSSGQRVMNSRGQAKYDLELWITPVKYSVTTSKHTTIAKRALQLQLTREAEENGRY